MDSDRGGMSAKPPECMYVRGATPTPWAPAPSEKREACKQESDKARSVTAAEQS